MILGEGRISEMNFKGLVQKVIGVDPDERIGENPFVDEFHVGFGDDMPYLSDASVDMVLCNNVLEHVTDPTRFFSEIYRVLKPSGLFLSKTPNRFHYVALVAGVTPIWFHKLYNRVRGREEEDTFPTLYRANTRRIQRRIAHKTGFKVNRIEAIEGRPEYLRLNGILYGMGMAYERIVNFFDIDALKVVLISEFAKPSS